MLEITRRHAKESTLSAQFRSDNITTTTAALRLSHRGYVLASVVLVVAALASWVLTGHAAGLMSLPLVAVFLGLDAQVRRELARRQTHPQG